ncbi:MAG: hypothetical protein M3N13_01280 [Candidatus Eremiobacteraeota bacterium]|nr:hypothetical protein [Candidatus Eremiobacteraeota bacterium]
MQDCEATDRRAQLLAAVERHWHELTLGDARSLSGEPETLSPQSQALIKATLTFR